MSKVQIVCPHCSKTLSLDFAKFCDSIGKKAKCANCPGIIELHESLMKDGTPEKKLWEEKGAERGIEFLKNYAALLAFGLIVTLMLTSFIGAITS